MRNLGYVALCFIAQNENSTISTAETKEESFGSHLVSSEPYLQLMNFRYSFVNHFDFASAYTY
jgi:hypothetical protein